MTDAPHLPVLLDEVLEALAPLEGRSVVDATFGVGIRTVDVSCRFVGDCTCRVSTLS